MLLLGIDIGTSSVKVSVLDGETGKVKAAAAWPETEAPIKSLKPGWAEQSPNDWWDYFKKALEKIASIVHLNEIGAVGIAYQMHGLVLTDADGKVLRDAIIWCDSRAVPYGDAAAAKLGETYCRKHLLNDPGNFTAAKLAWVKENEPDIYRRIHKMMLPGDYFGLRLTGSVTTSASALSEGIFWDFVKNDVSSEVLDAFGFDKKIIPEIRPVMSDHGQLSAAAAGELGLRAGIPVTYKAGDQPNNALSLNVMEPGEVAATAGTSGVIYAVTDELLADKRSRVNSFAHVSYSEHEKRIGVLLCINGTGSMNSWLKRSMGNSLSYIDINELAATAPEGSDGLLVLPFGNGAERIFENKVTGARFVDLDLNRHTQAHCFRAAQEGIAFAFRYGLDILRENGFAPSVIRAGYANMFLSPLFAQTFVNITGVAVELHSSDGSVGAAIGAGLGVGYYKSAGDAFGNKKALKLITPKQDSLLETTYVRWKNELNQTLNA
ncbi:MAG: xylulokinase [Chitinophagaceae bacterium]